MRLLKLWILMLLLPIMSLAIAQRDTYQICLNSTNRMESPADRDAQKVECYNNQARAQRTIGVCIKLARILEHTSASDTLLINCLSDNILKITIDECVATAKKMIYSENKDNAIWMCLENHAVRRNSCKKISEAMTFPHRKAAALNFCLTKP